MPGALDSLFSFRRNRTSMYTTLDSNSPTINHDNKYPLGNPDRIIKTVKAGSLNVLSSKFESLDYDICENNLLLDEAKKNGYSFVIRKNFARWFIFLLIGIFTAFVGIFVDLSIEILSDFKFTLLKKYIDECTLNKCFYLPYLIWVCINASSVLIGSLLVTYVEPIALGSGIPQVKCYLNGIKMPRIVRIKTLFVKSIGVVSAVVGGLACGKEGPMIHSGAVVAAGISQGKSTTFKKDSGMFTYFREDHEKRDFVSGGAAAGVAAAFGAPVGGVLFSLEEGASFWNQALTWRIFFASMISTFTLNLVLSAYHGLPGNLSYPGLLNFGQFTNLTYSFFELPLFVSMGIVGGLFGALFNYMNYKLTVFRIRYVTKKWMKVIEAVLIAAFTATISLFMIYFIDDCKPLGIVSTNYTIQLFCDDGEANSIAALWIQVPEASVRSLFHDPIGSHRIDTLSLFALVYFFLSVFTYGLSVSAGLFIPALLTGAAWGRVVGLGLETILPDAIWVDPGKYALVGAAAHLGGTVRMTISLTVILIEATGNISFGLPLMITLITAKWVGDFFNEGIYDIHIQLSGVPMLPWDPPPFSYNKYASEVMSHPVVVLFSVEKVGRIIDILTKTTYNGFPIVDSIEEKNQDEMGINSFGCIKGLILRSQLVVLLKNKIFVEYNENCDIENWNLDAFRKEYPRFPDIQNISLNEEEKNLTVDLRRFMNPSPYTVQYVSSLSRVFRLFRALGLRHLTVVNNANEVVGIVTRKDLARYRVWKHLGRLGVEELKISENM
uniref:Chloride channel protein n=1 Tax=Clastoptera arizonana TaxID=38151 RepID=A0A1B6CCK6_9HEMI